ncbi:MAG: AAA family ATPase [Ilumatobacter sp.]|uniref:HelD family protein n=1 Tax=Ilumatobacter sp. TaxID=1967498 RepID=UPI003299D893
MNPELFPELAAERAHLAFARTSRDGMIERLEAVDPAGAADTITQEYVEVTVAEALDTLRSPGAGDFFGRIDGDEDSGFDGSWYVGRRHIENDSHDPVVVDWRAPIAAPFYRATAVDPLGVAFRRRFTLDDGELIAYLDEQLDDPDAAGSAAGIPDPVLAEIGAERSGEMREIVATIQGEQDVVIRSDIDQVLIVQGGPGTGKTAVALHRAAYLLFEHRARLARDGVLVVGPNKAFLDYIANVLPSLGERTVRQATAHELCIPRVDVTGTDDADVARWKGSSDRLDDLHRAAVEAIVAPDEDIVVPIGVRNHVVTAGEFAEWIATAVGGNAPINERRARLTAIAKREMLRRSGKDDVWRNCGPLKSAITKAWPTQKPIKLVDAMLPGPKGRKRVWTEADQMLVDEANSLLNGSPFTYGHVVVDEAQDHSDVALRVIGRRSPAGSMTLVGDVAQSTTPAGQERWADVFAHLSPGGSTGVVADLTIGYRVPEPVLRVANRLLPLTGVDATESRSVRLGGDAPSWDIGSSSSVAQRTADATRETKRTHKLTGVVAPVRLHASIAASLAEVDLVAVDHVHELGPAEVPLFEPHAVKGLEFDGVVVVNPHDILGEGTDVGHTARGARLLYVAMTRAVQRLSFVSDAPPPDVISG